MNYLRFLGFVVVPLIAACAGAATPIACPDGLPALPTMISPASGSTNVPMTGSSIVLSFEYGTTLTLTAPGAPTVTSGQVQTLPVPSPGAGDQVPIPDVEYSLPTLRPSTTYTVDPPQPYNPDCPNLSPALGSFTTGS
jgi:hypothetical protein